MTTKNYCFTHNNYLDTKLEDSIQCQYIIYGKEVGESGTPHLQGFIRLNKEKTLSAMIKYMPGCHLEQAVTFEKAIEYCKKDGDWTERGKEPMTQKRKGECEETRWKEIILAAEENRLDDIPYEIKFNKIKLIEHHRDNYLKRRKIGDTTAQMLWYYGDSGTGKSRKAREDYPEAYLKMCNKWWDGYAEEEVVIIEDFDKNHSVLGHHLKIWGDRYPFLAERKGGTMKIRPKLIIVTSNWKPSEIWGDRETLEPIERRFKLHHFANL